MSYSIHDQFYIPLVDLTVDVNRLRDEVFKYVAPDQNDYGLTCVKEDADSDLFNFRKYSGVRVAADTDRYLLPSGHNELDIVHWPKILQGSYIEQLAIEITGYLGLTPPRCRLSYFNQRYYETNIHYHYDPHTPYRVHIALETTPESIWRYRWEPGMEEYTLHQPVTNYPVLIDTGAMQHGVFVPKYHNRLHLWYQFHSKPRQELIDALIEKYKLTLNKI